MRSDDTLATKSCCDPGITALPIPVSVDPVSVPSGAGGSSSGAFLAQAPTASMATAASMAVVLSIVLVWVLLCCRFQWGGVGKDRKCVGVGRRGSGRVYV